MPPAGQQQYSHYIADRLRAGEKQFVFLPLGLPLYRLEVGNMPGKTVYVPQFGSQLGSSQIDEPQMKQSNLSACNVARAQTAMRGKKRARGEKTQSVLKVKVPTVSNHTAKNGDTAPRRWTSEPTTTKSKSTVSRGEPCNVP